MARVDWSQLTDDLLVRIVENHISTMDDLVMFSCVCVAWHRAVKACDLAKLRGRWVTSQMPWLMLTDGNDQETYSETSRSPIRYLNKKDLDKNDREYDGLFVCDQDRGDNTSAREVEMEINEDVNEFTATATINQSDYMSIDNDIGDSLCYKRSVLNLRFNTNKCYNLELPEAYRRACWGSPYGWVVTLGLDRDLHLLNPLTKSRLPLPSQRTLGRSWKRARGQTIRDLFLNKAILLQVPDDSGNDSWLVVLLYDLSSLVAMARPGDKEWTPICWPTRDDLDCLFDVVYCKQMRSLLFINSDADLYCCELHNLRTGQPLLLKRYLESPDLVEVDYMKHVFPYMVELEDGLLIILRNLSTKLDFPRYETNDYQVYKLDLLTKCWQVVENLPGLALFVGNNVTMAISAQGAGARSNCIYFNDGNRKAYRRAENKLGGHDIGVFSMNDRTIQPFYDGRESLSSYCCPFWFSPAF